MGNVRVGLTPESHGRLDAVYRAHFPALMRVAYLLTGSNARAEDAVHEVFLRCADRLDHVERPGAYLRTAVVNECSRQFRRRQRDELSATVEEADDLPVELIELRAALQRLDMRKRAAIVLRYFVDLREEEIAKALGCRRATVRSLVHRGVAQLRKEL